MFARPSAWHRRSLDSDPVDGRLALQGEVASCRSGLSLPGTGQRLTTWTTSLLAAPCSSRSAVNVICHSQAHAVATKGLPSTRSAFGTKMSVSSHPAKERDYHVSRSSIFCIKTSQLTTASALPGMPPRFPGAPRLQVSESQSAARQGQLV